MQGQSIRRLLTPAAMAIIATLGSARSTFADLVVTVAEANYATQTIINLAGSPSSGLSSPGVNATEGDFTIQAQGATANQFTNISEELSSSTSVLNNAGVAKTLTITITATGYTSPSAGSIASLIGGSTPIGSTVVNYSSQVDGTLVTNPQFTATGTGAYSSTAFGGNSTFAIPFAITETVVLNVSAGGQINYSASTVVTATPEPATVAMALTALPLLGLGAWARRRRAIA